MKKLPFWAAHPAGSPKCEECRLQKYSKEYKM